MRYHDNLGIRETDLASPMQKKIGKRCFSLDRVLHQNNYSPRDKSCTICHFLDVKDVLIGIRCPDLFYISIVPEAMSTCTDSSIPGSACDQASEREAKEGMQLDQTDMLAGVWSIGSVGMFANVTIIRNQVIECLKSASCIN